MPDKIALLWNRPGVPPCEVPVIDGVLDIPTPLFINGTETEFSYWLLNRVKANDVTEDNSLVMTLWKQAWTWDD